MKLVTIFMLLLLGTSVQSYKILIPTMGILKSVSMLFEILARSLAERGHEVHLITAFQPAEPHPNLKIIHKPEFESVLNATTLFNMTSMLEFDKVIREFAHNVAHKTWNDPEIMQIWQRRNEYDVFIIISYFGEFSFPFIHDFNGQIVQFITPGIEAISLSRQGNWLSPAIVPDIQLSLDDEMTFFERVQNLPVVLIGRWFQHSYAQYSIGEAKKFFPDLDPYESYYDRVALSLINGHYAIDGMVTLLPNQVEIGTLNIRKPKPLPKDLQDFMDGAGDAGVIYFSLGTAVSTDHLPPHAMDSFIEAFKRIPQRVVWKYDSKKKLPPNVLAKKWMPQQDILSHSKTKAFISHCGNQGTQEAKYFGVPVLGIPIAFDQPRNAARMERKGLALVLTWHEVTPENIVQALNKLVNETSYKEKINQVSRILQDQKETPAERAVWWIEYVVRHKGAPQLEYAGKKMYLFQFLMLDVLAFWFASIILIVLMFVKIIKMICCRTTKRKQKKA